MHQREFMITVSKVTLYCPGMSFCPGVWPFWGDELCGWLPNELRSYSYPRLCFCLFAKITDQRTQQRETSSTIIEVILYDVTERAERELQTRFEADHDLLTHLLNRRSGEKKLHKMLFFSIKKQQPFVLMMIDLDKFKPINDTYGHEAGDKVLQEIAKRITTMFGKDTNVCIRWGADEFVIAFHVDNADNKAIKKQAEVLLMEIEKPIQILPDVSSTVGASIGLVIAPEHGKVLHELLVNADNSLYKVKEQGRGHVEFYSPKS